MNKLIILLPALFIAGSISSVNATNDNINKINIIEDSNIQLPKDKKDIHDLIFDKTKFEENQEKIFKYIAHGKADKNTNEYADYKTKKIYSQKIVEDYKTRKIYCQEILKLIIEENKYGNKMFINELLTDSNLTKGIIHMMAIIDMDKGFYKYKTETKNSSDKNFIFENQYTLLSYIITNKDKIINDKDKDELINEYIQEMFSAVFSYMYHKVEKTHLSAENEMELSYRVYNSTNFPEEIVNFFDNITDKAVEDKDKNLVLQKILEYMYQKFYKPYKEFMNNDLDINKSAAFKEFAEKVFGNYNMMYMVNSKTYYTPGIYNDTEKYASNTYNTLLMLFIYNGLVISFTKNKLKLQNLCDAKYAIDTIFNEILKLTKESKNKTNNETNEMLMSFYLKTLFLIIYNKKIDDSKFLNDLLNHSIDSKIICDLLNLNCIPTISCDKYNNLVYDKGKLYFFNDECKSEYDAEDQVWGARTEDYNYYGMLLINNIKLLLNLFDNKMCESIDIEDLEDSSLVIPMPLMYIKLITDKKSRSRRDTKTSSYDHAYEYDYNIERRYNHIYKDELKNFNYKFLNIRKHLCNNNSSNNKESNKIEKKNNIIEEELVKIDKNSALDKIMNDKNFINEIQTTKEYTSIKLILGEINKHNNLIDNLQKLGLNIMINKPVEHVISKEYSLEKYIYKCIDFYNKLISNEKQYES